MFEAFRPDVVMGIIGAGLMGRGIAQLAAEAGVTVLLADASPEALDKAQGFCRQMIARKVETGKLSRAAGEAAIARLRCVPADACNCMGAFAPCHVVIEAVPERMELKSAVLRGLEAVVRDDCIIATNTSSLSVTGLAAAARRPQRVAGFHFFNPVPLVRLVEVIAGELTADWVLDGLEQLARRLGHEAVRVTDTPGFLVNHAGRAYLTEALRIVAEGICSFSDIDRVMVDAAQFRMGPFELMDLVGLDVSHPVMESIYHRYYEEPRYRPSVLTARRAAAGLLGRKSGRGFYDYSRGKAEKPGEPPLPEPSGAVPPVWVSSRHAHGAERLRALLAACGASVERAAHPTPEALILVAPLGEDATTAALAEGLDPRRTVAVDGLFDFERRRVLMGTPVTGREAKDAARRLLSSDGTPVTWANDSPGFIAQRIVAMIVNTACDIAQQRIARPEDIDRAVCIALAYPQGPLAWGDRIGARRILAILDAMSSFYGDPRYRPSPWLKRRAMLGISLLAPDEGA